MEVVLDSVCINHLLRKPKKIKKKSNKNSLLTTPLDKAIKGKRLTLGIDKAGGLVDEWKRTCGDEIIQELIIYWESFGGIVPFGNLPAVPPAVARKFRELGFQGTIDKLILKLGLVVDDKTIVSEDSHFWDPSDPGKRGNPQAPIAILCWDKLGIKIILLGTLIDTLR